MYLIAHLLVAFASLTSIFAQTIQQSTPPVPAGYTYIGCYTDSAATRGLTGGAHDDPDGNTALECASVCGGTVYFGLEFGSQCFCGDILGPTSVKTDESQCMDYNYVCPGHYNDYFCGGNNAFAVYQINPAAPIMAVTSTVTVTATVIQSPTCAVPVAPATVTITATVIQSPTCAMTVAPATTPASSKSSFQTSTSAIKTKTKDKNDKSDGGDKKTS